MVKAKATVEVVALFKTKFVAKCATEVVATARTQEMFLSQL